MPIKLTPENMRYDEAENIIDDNIKKVKNNIITKNEAIETLKENSLVTSIYTNDLIEKMVEHDITKKSLSNLNED